MHRTLGCGVVARTGTAVAVDIGGTKIAAGVVTADGDLLRRESAPTRQATMFDDLLVLIARVREGDEVLCGVGCGGPMTRGGETVSPLNIPAWREFPLRARLGDSLGIDVFVDNDAKALALGEGWVGAAKGVDNFLAMVVSTGVGGGIVLDGRLLDGEGGNAGHIGHVIVEPNGRECGCGARGCLEAEASGLAIAATTGGPPADAPEEARVRAGTLVGRAVASVANLLDLRLALVGGSVALGYGDRFFAAAQEEIDARAKLDFSAGCVIRPVGLGDRGPLIGAAAVGWRGHAQRYG
jgi:glucokinase